MNRDSRLVGDLAPSPNHDERRGADRPDILLLHYTGMTSGAAALERLCDPSAAVSCHYLVEEDGRIFQLVAEARRAWHAGAGSWEGRGDINSRSIGIEIVNPGHEIGYRPFPPAQIDAVIDLCRDCVVRHGIAARRVLAHSDTAPDRKEDPGELFPWDRLSAAGIGLHVPPAPVRGGRFLSLGDAGEPVAAFQGLLAAFGYGVEIDGRFEERTRRATIAFQRHHRPTRIDGVADASTVETLHRLAVLALQAA